MIDLCIAWCSFVAATVLYALAHRDEPFWAGYLEGITFGYWKSDEW